MAMALMMAKSKELNSVTQVVEKPKTFKLPTQRRKKKETMELSAMFQPWRKLDIWRAAEWGDLDVVISWVKVAAPYWLNEPSEEGSTPLLWAATTGQYIVCMWLLKEGAKVDYQNHAGNSPLHWACFHGHEKVVSLLLENGADPDLKNKSDVTPEYLAKNDAIRELIQKERERRNPPPEPEEEEEEAQEEPQPVGNKKK